MHYTIRPLSAFYAVRCRTARPSGLYGRQD